MAKPELVTIFNRLTKRYYGFNKRRRLVQRTNERSKIYKFNPEELAWVKEHTPQVEKDYFDIRKVQ